MNRRRALLSVVPPILVATTAVSCVGGAHVAPARPSASGAERWATDAGSEASVGALAERARAGEASALELALLCAGEEGLGRPADAARHCSEAVESGLDEASPEGLVAAEASAVMLSALVEWVPRTPERLRALAAALDQRSASPRLTYLVQRALLASARRAGNADEEARARARAGCLVEWEGAGAFGPHSLLSFDATHAPAEPGPLPAVVSLGAGRGRATTFRPEARGCDVDLASPGPQWGGTTYGVTFVDQTEARQVVLRLETVASARLWVNDELVLSRDQRAEYLPAVHFVTLQLPAGRSKLVVGLTSRFGGAVFSASLLDRAGRPVVAGQRARSAAGYDLVPPRRVAPAAPPEPADAALAYMLARIALAEGAPARARELVEDAGEAFSATPAALLLRAASWAADRAVPFDVARNRTLALHRRALESAPGLWMPHFEQARHHANEERYAEALERASAGVEAAPRHPALHLLRASLLATRSLWHDAEAAIGAAESLAPDSCAPREARWALVRGRERAVDRLEVARQLGACDRTSDAFAQALVAARRWDEAASEIRRLIALDGERPMLLVSLAEALRGRGALEEEARVLERLLARNPEDRAALLDLVDLAASTGGEDDAQALVDRATDRVPADLLLERRIRALLSGEELLHHFRVDGREAIARFEDESPEYDVPSVLVLDRTVFRIFADGSVVELTHTVTRVLNDEGVELEGELEVAPGTILLAARTIKPDGRVLEPEDIRGKASLSLPALAPGDYIETELLRGHEPPPEFPGGAWPWRFYFQGYRRAFHHSELVVVAPREMPLRISARGAEVPSEEREVGALRMLRWVARAVPTAPDEPAGPNSDELMPSVLVTSGASWAGYRDALREALADRARPSRELLRTAEEVVAAAEADGDEERLDALVRWIAENVEPGTGALEPVAHMLASRTGERTRLLVSMARAVGLPAELGLARSTAEDQTDDDVPSLSAFGYPVARVGEAWRFVGEDARWAPACYVPPGLRGQPVLMMEGTELFARLPEEGCRRDVTEIDARFRLAADGTASGRVVETLSGFDAVLWRRRLARTAEDDRIGAFEEGYAADALPGGEVTRLEVTGEREPERPLVLEYDVSGARIVQDSGAVRGLLFPFRMELGQYAGLAARTTPLVVHEPYNRVVQLALQLPDGTEVQPPDEAALASELGEYGSFIEAEPGRLVLRRWLELRPGRIEPGRYGVFAAFCRLVDRVEETPVPLSAAGD